MSEKKLHGRYPWQTTDYEWLMKAKVMDVILDKLLNQNFVTRNDIWKSFGLPATTAGKSTITSANEFFSTLDAANDTCKKLYGMTLEEKCKADADR